MRTLKCVVVGDGAIPIKELLTVYTTGKQPIEGYIPVNLDGFSADLSVDGQRIHLQLWDVAGQEDYKKLRPLTYPQTDVFVICFSFTSPTSLENVRNMWVPELDEHCPGRPRILVGLCLEMRETVAADPDAWKRKGMEAVPSSKAESVKTQIGATAYIECSVTMETNVKKVFEEAVRAALAAQPQAATSEGGCCEVA
jgi:small GTP-binding protein